MSSVKNRWLWFLPGILVAVWLAVRIFSHEKAPGNGSPHSGNETMRPAAVRPEDFPASSSEEAEAEETEKGNPIVHLPDSALEAELKVLRERLRERPDREIVLRLLREFATRFLAAHPDRAAATLLAFLRSGDNEATGLDFAVGESGLDEWPSLRAFLLDLLGKIDPELASRYALEAVIPAKTSTVEYAVSMQILWNHGGAEKPTPELTQAWLGLVQKPDWAARPDAAWLESLDFASRIPEATPQFLEAATPWLARPGEASGKAETAEMVLERMMVRHPGETLAALLHNPQWMDEGRGPAVRATLFARTDSTDSGQVQLLKTYLQKLDPQSQEAAAFYRAFPCHNYGVAPGLSGSPDIPDAEEIQGRLKTDLDLLAAWQNDPVLAPHRNWMVQAKKRIEDILGPTP